jgi:hypothetical protein
VIGSGQSDGVGGNGNSYFGAIPGLLGVSSDGACFRGYIYGSPGDGDETGDGHFPLTVHLKRRTGNLFHPPDNEPGFVNFGRYSVDPGRQEVRYSRKLIFNRHGQWTLKREAGTFCLTYNSTYARYSELIMTMHPVPDLLASIFSYYLLLENDYLSLHCSAVNFHDNTTAAIFALPNTGKTQTAYKLVTEHGAKLVAEDVTVFGRSQLFPCPFTRSGAYFLTRKTVSRPFWTKRAYAERLFDYLDDERVCLSGPVAPPSRIIILRPGQKAGSRKLSADEAFSMVYGLNSTEFEGIARHSLLDISGILRWPDLGILDPKRHELTRALVDGCRDELYELTAPDSDGFAELTLNV